MLIDNLEGKGSCALSKREGWSFDELILFSVQADEKNLNLHGDRSKDGANVAEMR